MPAAAVASVLFFVAVVMTGPAPYTDLLKHSISRLPLTVSEFEAIAEDNVLSLVEISDALCDVAARTELDAGFHCWIADNWPLPKSIQWL